MKNAIFICVVFTACNTAAKNLTTKEKQSGTIIYPYASVYKSPGVIITDTALSKR